MLSDYRRYLLEGEAAGARYELGRPFRAPSGQAGMQMARRAGSSLEFKDHREYEPGDDPRHIDWNAYGRSGRLIVKLYHQEVSPHVDVVLDGSLSMALNNTEKARALLGLAAIFAMAAANSGYTHSGWLAGKELKRVGNGDDRPGRWEGIAFDYRGVLGLNIASAAWRRPGMRVLLSDLLWPAEPSLVLSHFTHQATSVVVVQILAREDADPIIHGPVRLLDCETGEAQEILLDARAAQRYRQSLTRHQQSWHRACRQIGAAMVSVVAEDIVADWRLQDLLAAQILE